MKNSSQDSDCSLPLGWEPSCTYWVLAPEGSGGNQKLQSVSFVFGIFGALQGAAGLTQLQDELYPRDCDFVFSRLPGASLIHQVGVVCGAWQTGLTTEDMTSVLHTLCVKAREGEGKEYIQSIINAEA